MERIPKRKIQYLKTCYTTNLNIGAGLDWEKDNWIAIDKYYDGDSGSGGSIIEAGVDDFKILVFNDGVLGDVNYDGELNVQDVVIIINMILGSIESDLIADMNNDGGINIQDVILLLNLIIG